MKLLPTSHKTHSTSIVAVQGHNHCLVLFFVAKASDICVRVYVHVCVYTFGRLNAAALPKNRVMSFRHNNSVTPEIERGPF